MRRMGLSAVSFLLALALIAPLAAQAGQKFTLTVSPELFQDMTGDSTAGSLPGAPMLQCPGAQPPYTLGGPCPSAGIPRTTLDTNLDYGLAYQLNPRWSLSYTHSAFDFSLGRLLTPGTVLSPGSTILTGDIMDRTDQGTLSYAWSKSLTLDAYYSSHQRINVDALAPPLLGGGCLLNQEQCPGHISNPSSINSNVWGAGLAYSFGPHAAYEPPMYKVTFDVNYYPRPNDPNCLAANPQPACNTNGQPGYRGSGAVFPYSVTMFPLAAFPHMPLGFLPFVAYNRLYSWFHAENTPETYNAVAFGFVQILPHGFSFSYTNFKLNGCYCSDTVPPPDSIRSDTNIYKLSYELKF